MMMANREESFFIKSGDGVFRERSNSAVTSVYIDGEENTFDNAKSNLRSPANHSSAYLHGSWYVCVLVTSTRLKEKE